MAKKEMKDVVVAVDPKHKKQMKALIGKLEDKGFVLADSLTEIGVLTGSAPADAIKDLKRIDGVENVELNRTDYSTQ
jgi:hypothetical protein